MRRTDWLERLTANSSVLSDVRFPIEKRLFLTATPRVFDASVKRSLAARGLDSASMDDTELFGRRLYSLPFGAAIEKGLLTDYQIAFIGVTRAEIAELATAKVNLERTAGNHSDLSMLVAEVATLKAIRRFGLSTLISFHSTVKRARYFSDELHVTAKALGQGSAEGAAEIWATHVDGGMPTGTRAARLRLLRDGTPERPILVSNARCLTEGVDVPTLDGVVFADPKRSKTDIVQAVGRAFWRSAEKKIGTIVLPVVVPDSSTPEASLESSDFRYIWNVLGALRAHDDVLSDELDALREEAMVVGHVNALPSKMVFDFPIQGDDYLETFAQHFRIEVLNQSASSWSWWFGALRRFVAREGTSRVPRKHVERIGGDNVKLGQWVASLRDPERRGRLTETQITQLEALPDWSWNPYEDEFQKHLTA